MARGLGDYKLGHASVARHRELNQGLPAVHAHPGALRNHCKPISTHRCQDLGQIRPEVDSARVAQQLHRAAGVRRARWQHARRRIAADAIADRLVAAASPNQILQGALNHLIRTGCQLQRAELPGSRAGWACGPWDPPIAVPPVSGPAPLAWGVDAGHGPGPIQCPSGTRPGPGSGR